MPTWVKICGLTNAGDARLAVQLGADALGFVFHPSSERYCAPDRAREIIGGLPPCQTVGVWFDESADTIAVTARHVGCTRVQTYDPSVAISLRSQGFHVIPAIPKEFDGQPNGAWSALCDSWTGLIVLDRSRTVRQGPSLERTRDRNHFRLASAILGPDACAIFAGGLTPENVFDQLESYRPAGVDVSAGLEFTVGRKDPAKMIRFMEEVRRWDAMAGSANLAVNSCPRR